MFLKSENVLLRVGESTKKLINAHYGDLFESYQENMTEMMKGSNFVFDYVDKLYYRCHKISLNRDGLYKQSTTDLKKKIKKFSNTLSLFLYIIKKLKIILKELVI